MPTSLQLPVFIEVLELNVAVDLLSGSDLMS